MNHQFTRRRKAILTALLFACLGLLSACSRSQAAKESTATANETNGAADAQPATKRYTLTGRVVSVDKPNQSINIDGDEIPGFMSAMQMPYPVKDATQLDRVAPCNVIKAEIVMGGDGAYLEKIVVLDKSPARGPAK